MSNTVYYNILNQDGEIIMTSSLGIGYLDLTLRLFAALVAGSVIGFERTRAKKPAGIRTHALVCIASATITIISAYGVTEFAQTRTMDPLRLAAQIVSGIGFLGAGVIWKQSKGEIRGLTTATNIWAVAGIGIAAGLGHYYLVFITVSLLKLALKVAKILEFLGFIVYDDPKTRSHFDDLDDDGEVT